METETIRTWYRRALRTLTLAGALAVLLAAGWFHSLETLHMAKAEPDRWHNVVCSAKDQGATQAQTAKWLVRQYGLDPYSAKVHTHNHWPLCG